MRPSSSRSPRRNDPRTARALVLSDVRIVREALVEFLSARLQVTVRGSSPDPMRLRATVGRSPPSTVLVDCLHADADFIRLISQLWPLTQIVAFGYPPRAASILSLAEAGVRDFLSPEASHGRLARIIAGRGSRSSELTEAILEALVGRLEGRPAQGKRKGSAGATLSLREVQVLVLIEQGQSNKEIADHLCLAVPTVKNHTHQILKKLGLHHRGEAAAELRRGSLSVLASLPMSARTFRGE
jgi:two-component system, NarL family, nitrate/nitrite response regulator NarL